MAILETEYRYLLIKFALFVLELSSKVFIHLEINIIIITTAKGFGWQ